MARIQATNIHAFLAQGTEVKVLADKHFPHDCYERHVLLDVEATFQILGQLHRGLERAQDHIDRIRHMALPDEREIIALAIGLKKTADSCAPGSDSQKAFQRAGELLHVWYDLSLSLQKLLSDTEELRFGIGEMPGQA